jgi:hypothetical protein
MKAGRAVEISVSPLFSVLQKENLGEPHTILAGGERYFSPRFGRESEGVLREELGAAGLGEEGDYLEFLDLVNVVQRGNAEFFGWVTGIGEYYGLLVASYGRRAVSVLRTGDTLRFERQEPEKMLEALVESLPDVPVGRGEPISVGHAEFHSSQSRAPGSVMRRSASARPDAARRLDALLAARRRYVTKLYAAKRDSRGVRQRSERWVTVLDLVDGRWAISVAETRRAKWISAAPGTPQSLTERLRELARSIR